MAHRVACCISNAICAQAPGLPHACARAHTHTHRIVQYLLLFHGNNDSRTRLNVTLYAGYLFCFFVLYLFMFSCFCFSCFLSSSQISVLSFLPHCILRTSVLRFVSSCFPTLFCCSLLSLTPCSLLHVAL